MTRNEAIKLCKINDRDYQLGDELVCVASHGCFVKEGELATVVRYRYSHDGGYSLWIHSYNYGVSLGDVNIENAPNAHGFNGFIKRGERGYTDMYRNSFALFDYAIPPDLFGIRHSTCDYSQDRRVL